MKGELHERLRATLLRATEAGVCTQDSLGQAMDGKSQRSVGQYLNNEAGALDLDEATAALEHVNSTLREFIDGLPPRELSRTERLARALVTRPALADLVEDLLPVPKKELSHVIDLARELGQIATRTRGAKSGGRSGGSPRAPRTTKAPKPRR